MLPPILPSQDYLHDFPVLVIIRYKASHITGRQHIYFSDIHNYLCLYNHSSFLKMHMHNAWLLGVSELVIDLPDNFFQNTFVL